MLYTIYLKTYSGCQLHCKHCFTNGKNGGNTTFDLEKTIDWFTRLDKYLPSNDKIHVELHGGEPLLADTNLILELVRYLKKLDRDISIGMTSNLTLKISDKIVELFTYLDGVATSWDKGIRFANSKQEDLWEYNVRTYLPYIDFKVLNISLSYSIIKMDILTLLNKAIDLKFDKISIERITLAGNANTNNEIIPTNRMVSDYYLRLHQVTKDNNLRDKIYNTLLEDVYAKFESNNSRCGTFCRDCESSIFTINPNGTIGGCPNTATNTFYGSIDDEIDKLFNLPKRIEFIVNEQIRNPICYTCDLFIHCNSGCHQLAWDRDCPSPRELMTLLLKGN